MPGLYLQMFLRKKKNVVQEIYVKLIQNLVQFSVLSVYIPVSVLDITSSAQIGNLCRLEWVSVDPGYCSVWHCPLATG